ncbi:hypothetical protein [Streptomyces carpinensis]|uniref:Uncharacterized protein n=1 Tax=Streptomyces carpinensis TaxID=66369 RepID=A0ABV1W1P4_9ACTN|nr:hypothetical protein [Streptomyces carpinensis]
MVALIDALEPKGIVARKPGPNDLRRNAIELTEPGLALYWEADAECVAAEDLRGFVAILRAEGSAQDRVAFLREHRAALEQRVAALLRAMEVLDEKIAYYS